MFTVELFTEDDIDSLGTYQVECLSEVTTEIKDIEESGAVVDYVRVTGAKEQNWYLVEDDLTFSGADEEISESLDLDYSDDVFDLIAESGWFEEMLAEESEELDEQLKRRVDSKGKVSRVKSKKVRSRRATRTTGMSKSALKRRSKKSARTRKKDVGGTKRAGKKRKKAMRRRRSMGVK